MEDSQRNLKVIFWNAPTQPLYFRFRRVFRAFQETLEPPPARHHRQQLSFARNQTELASPVTAHTQQIGSEKVTSMLRYFFHNDIIRSPRHKHFLLNENDPSTFVALLIVRCSRKDIHVRYISSFFFLLYSLTLYIEASDSYYVTSIVHDVTAPMPV